MNATELTDDRARELSQILGVSTEALKALRIAWRDSDRTYTLAEVDGNRRVVGINRRYGDGSQKAIFGGRLGLAVPDGLSDRPDPALIVEGASDVAACLTIGVTAVGCPSNRGGAEHLAKLLADREVLIGGEHDPKPDGTWPGKDGAIIVARSLSKAWETAVRWTLPPDGAKDIRQWLNDRGLDLQNEADRSKTGRELLESLKRNANAITIKTKSRCNTEEGPRQSQATILRKLIESTGVELFHDPDREAWATIPMGKHRETHHVHTKGFRIWAQGLFYRSEGKAVGSQAVQDALGAIAATAIFDGPQQDVHVRLAERDGCIYLDLADELWRAVRISARGWELLSDYPVKFHRPKGMMPLPVPQEGGSITKLREHVNVVSDDDFILMVAWLLAAFRPIGPFPVLACSGEHGSAKSTGCKALHRLIDPNKSDLRSPPTDVRDVMIVATNGWCLALGNMSHMKQWLSDCLCRIAAGGGFATRELYSDREETILDAQRPILLNGIPDLGQASDLNDRKIAITLPNIGDDKRISERVFWGRFNEARPGMLGAILDAVATGLRNIDRVKLDRVPRMADFCEWILACEPALPWESGRFMQAYLGNRSNSHELALEASIVAPTLRAWLVTVGGRWLGTASELLHCLDEYAGEKLAKQKGWPTLPHVLSGMLWRMAPDLRAVGIPIKFDNREPGTGRRVIRLGGSCDAQREGPVPSVTGASRRNPHNRPKNGDCDARDACDAVSPVFSNTERFDV